MPCCLSANSRPISQLRNACDSWKKKSWRSKKGLAPSCLRWQLKERRVASFSRREGRRNGGGGDQINQAIDSVIHAQSPSACMMVRTGYTLGCGGGLGCLLRPPSDLSDLRGPAMTTVAVVPSPAALAAPEDTSGPPPSARPAPPSSCCGCGTVCVIVIDCERRG